MNIEKKAAKKTMINRLQDKAIDFEQTQQWIRAAIHWEYCAKVAQKNEDKGFFAYSSFFCYHRAADIPKATAMIEQCRNKYLLAGDNITAAMCAAELEAM